MPAVCRSLPVLRVCWRDPATLLPSPQAAKAHPLSQIQALACSMAAFGLDQPLVIDGEDRLIKGHGRLLAARQLEMRQVPVIVRNDLDFQEVRAARLADNRTAESHWLPGPLAEELQYLSSLRPGLLPATGFSQEQIQGLIQAETPPEAVCRAYRTDKNGVTKQCPHCGGQFAS